MFMTNAMKEAIDKAYERGYATGRAEHALEAFEDEKRRNEQLYKWAFFVYNDYNTVAGGAPCQERRGST